MTRSELDRLERQAAAGDADTQYRAGCARHDDDNESLRSIDRAVRWLRQAAAQGHAPAARRLCYLYVIDEGDMGEGIRWYSEAAERGDGPAASSLGQLFGDRERRASFFDPIRAIAWLERALSAGQAQAGVGLGLLLLGRDLPGRDP